MTGSLQYTLWQNRRASFLSSRITSREKKPQGVDKSDCGNIFCFPPSERRAVPTRTLWGAAAAAAISPRPRRAGDARTKPPEASTSTIDEFGVVHVEVASRPPPAPQNALPATKRRHGTRDWEARCLKIQLRHPKRPRKTKHDIS